MSTVEILTRRSPRFVPIEFGALRISMIAAMIAVGVVVLAALALLRRHRRPGPVSMSIVAGTVGAFAMVPVGLMTKMTAGAEINIYGELIVERLLGVVLLPALFVEHLLIGWMAALPLVIGIRHLRRSPAVLGAIYGAAMWLGVNALALPLLFERPTPFALGWNAIWPSLLVHVVYGTVTAAVATRLSPASEARPAVAVG